MPSEPRTLRSPELRAALYYAADGKCQICGEPLEEDWHADHIIPWKAVARTNVHEMQALCRSCNLAKGMKVMQGAPFHISTSRLRPGQRQAVDTIIDRIREKKSHTAIVLPTRYGKTDVMRVSGLTLWRDRLVSCALVVEPNTVLRGQAVNGDKWRDAMARYNIIVPMPVPMYEVDRRPTLPFPPHNAVFAAITTQMVNHYKSFFAQWVEHEIRSQGIPPIIYIDEAHTGSEVNQWGDSVGVLAGAGAYVVLLTATPYRTDNRRIPGFEDILIEERATTVTVPRRRIDETGETVIDLYEGMRNYYKLNAHHITTFRQAWDEEDPSPLCKITRRTFAVDLAKIIPSTAEVSSTRLADLNDQDSQRWLMPSLKDLGIIHQACEILVEVLASRKADASESAAIVFVGNDDQSDDELNQHATNVQTALKQLQPNLKTLIATSSDGDRAPELINDFAYKGLGDVLIVKQMASVGLDIARLKVCLDLSNIRTPASFVQRMTRICTIWERGSNPDDHVRTAIYICPDDVRGTALFKRFVIDEGGEAQVSDLTYTRTVKPPQQVAEPERPIYMPESVSLPESYEDTDQKEADGTTIPVVDRFLQVFPEVSRSRTHVDIAERLELGGIRVTAMAGHVRNTNQEEEKEIQRINEVRRKIVNRELPNRLGRPYKRGDPEAGRMIGRLIIEVWDRHKRQAGIHPSMDIRDVHDIPALQKIRQSMWREYYGGFVTPV